MITACGQPTCSDCPIRVVCRCLQVTEEAVVEALTTRPIQSVKDLRRHTGAGDGCTACHHTLEQYIEDYAYSASASPICSVR